MIIDKAYYVVQKEHHHFGFNEFPPIGELEIGEKLHYDSIRKFINKCKKKRIDESIIEDLTDRLGLEDPYGFRVYFDYQYAYGQNMGSV